MSAAVKILPVPKDDNRNSLYDSATQMGCGLITLTTDFQDLKFPKDIKSCGIVVVSGTLVLRGTFPINRVALDNAAIVDNLDGTVTIACTAHGLTDGDPVRFYRDATAGEELIPLPGYTAEYEILAAGDANSFVITEDYTALTPLATDWALGYIDPTFAAGVPVPLPLVAQIMAGIAQVKASVACVISVFVTR